MRTRVPKVEKDLVKQLTIALKSANYAVKADRAKDYNAAIVCYNEVINLMEAEMSKIPVEQQEIFMAKLLKYTTRLKTIEKKVKSAKEAAVLEAAHQPALTQGTKFVWTEDKIEYVVSNTSKQLLL